MNKYAPIIFVLLGAAVLLTAGTAFGTPNRSVREGFEGSQGQALQPAPVGSDFALQGKPVDVRTLSGDIR